MGNHSLTPQDESSHDAMTLAQKLKDKIHLDLAELMPDEMWEKVLQEHINTFLNRHTEQDQYGRARERPPLLQQIVHSVLEEQARAKIKKMLESEEWTEFWEDGKQMAGIRIEKLIKENAAEILYALLQQSFQNVVSQMGHQM